MTPEPNRWPRKKKSGENIDNPFIALLPLGNDRGDTRFQQANGKTLKKGKPETAGKKTQLGTDSDDGLEQLELF
jgi:hypothetical protein